MLTIYDMWRIKRLRSFSDTKSSISYKFGGCRFSLVLFIILLMRDCVYYLGVDLEIVARGTPGFSGADLANLVNQAALHGSALGREAVMPEDLDFAK